MEIQPILNSSKEIIAFLANKFPLCFVMEGEAHPLKIGIFRDMVQRLKEENCPISNTQLRAALRLYTTSWRYFYGMKENAIRVDLDGKGCGVLEPEHVEHAKEQLKKSKLIQQNKQREQRKESSKIESNQAKNINTANKVHEKVEKTKEKKPLRSQNKVKEKDSKTVKVTSTPISEKRMSDSDIAGLSSGQIAKVQVGKTAVNVTILSVNKNEIRVRLISGIEMLVRSEHLLI